MCFGTDASPPDLPAGHAHPDLDVHTELLVLESADGTRLSAALARAPHPAGPAVVILPDVRGLYPFYERLAERFAQAGHHAIAVDYFGRTAGPGRRADGFDFMPHVAATTLDGVQADVAAARSAIGERTGAEQVVAVGFCFGGTQAFLAAANSDLGLAGVVGFYGRLDPERFPAPADRADRMRVPVLGLFGGDDPAIPADRISEFDAALRRAGVPHELVVYPGAPHSFFDRSFEIHAEASADAWKRLLEFVGNLPVAAG